MYELAKDWGIFLAKIMKVLTAVILLIPHLAGFSGFFYGVKKLKTETNIEKINELLSAQFVGRLK